MSELMTPSKKYCQVRIEFTHNDFCVKNTKHSFFTFRAVLQFNCSKLKSNLKLDAVLFIPVP